MFNQFCIKLELKQKIQYRIREKVGNGIWKLLTIMDNCFFKLSSMSALDVFVAFRNEKIT